MCASVAEVKHATSCSPRPYTGVLHDEGGIMPILTVTARGQVTLGKEVLQHLGIKPGDKIELDLLPGARCIFKAAPPSGTIESFFGLFAGRTSKVATLEEIEKASVDAWSGKE
jgi:bifunctional DNA-binding transcriptional regulator/antitoxin component of YhaV-PrlF toxin-antitoxin module